MTHSGERERRFIANSDFVVLIRIIRLNSSLSSFDCKSRLKCLVWSVSSLFRPWSTMVRRYWQTKERRNPARRLEISGAAPSNTHARANSRRRTSLIGREPAAQRTLRRHGRATAPIGADCGSRGSLRRHGSLGSFVRVGLRRSRLSTPVADYSSGIPEPEGTRGSINWVPSRDTRYVSQRQSSDAFYRGHVRPGRHSFIIDRPTMWYGVIICVKRGISFVGDDTCCLSLIEVKFLCKVECEPIRSAVRIATWRCPRRPGTRAFFSCTPSSDGNKGVPQNHLTFNGHPFFQLFYCKHSDIRK